MTALHRPLIKIRFETVVGNGREVLAPLAEFWSHEGAPGSPEVRFYPLPPRWTVLGKVGVFFHVSF